jgi:hypothetical protein
MKRFPLYAFLLITAICCAQFTNAQDKDKKKKHEMHIKVKTIKDGKETLLDTIIHEMIDHDEIMKLIELKGFSDSTLNEHKLWFSKGDLNLKGDIVLEALNLHEDSISADRMKIIKRIKKGHGHDHAFFMKMTGDSCMKENIKIEVISDGDHKFHVHPRKFKKAERIIIVEEGDNVTIEEKDGHKIIKIKTTGDEKVWIEKHGEHDVDVDVEVTVEEKDGKKVKKLKRKKAKKIKKEEK